MAILNTNIGNLSMKNPVMTASGTFGYGLEFEDFVPLGGIGGIIVAPVYYAYLKNELKLRKLI